ncbi:MAG: thiamine phosphate synthase [Eggerthellales bacterium]|nr:thiamine phosphate synthase [Eggerthellales bacterium]
MDRAMAGDCVQARAQSQAPDSPRRWLQEHPEALILYGVSDNAWLAGRTLGECCAQAVSGGVSFLQIRDKEASTARLVEEYRQVSSCLAETLGCWVPLVINDDVAAALASGADGVHVGQDDMACARARQMLGPHKIVGVSAQTVEQALAAQEAGADYLGVGALIPTPTKPDAVDVTYQQLQEICQAVDIPVVGIGGLNLNTLKVLKGSGVAGAAVVSAVFAAEDIRQASADLRRELNRVLT